MRPRRRLLTIACLALLAAGQPGAGQTPAAEEPEVIDVVQPTPADTAAPADDAPGTPPDSTSNGAPPAVRVRPTGGLRVETAALILSGQQGGTVPFAALALPLPGTSERARVPVLIEIDGSSLPPTPAGAPLRVEIFVYALAGATLQGSLLETLEADAVLLGPAVTRTGLRYTGEIALLPGTYTLRVLAGDSATSQLGLRSTPLVVPDFKSANPALLTPLFPGAESWVDARSVRTGAAAGGSLAALAGGALPAARPILTPGKAATFRLPVFQAGADLAPRVEARRVGGDRIADWPARIEGRAAGEPAGIEVLTLTFTPRDLPPGEYEIAVVAGETRSAAMVVYLLNDGGGVEVWAEITPAGGAAPAVASAPAAAGRKPGRQRRIDARPVQDSYRQALVRLGAGDDLTARAAVAELEIGLLTRAEPVPRDELEEIQVEVLRRLRDTAPESLVPLLPLYAELAESYQARRLVQPAMHAVTMVFNLVELYVEKSPAPESRQLAAAFLAGLAPTLYDAGLTGFTDRALRRAIDLDPEQEAALLCLAIQAERLGRYDDAQRLLERLLRSHPENAEARLRTGITAARQSKEKEARRLLTDVLEAPVAPEPWVLSLAYQELADLALAEGDLAAAARTVEAGLARLPGDEKLRLQQALLLDLRGKAREATAAVDDLRPLGSERPVEAAGSATVPPTAGETTTARHRYNQLPKELLLRTRRNLGPDITRRLPALATAMTPTKSRGGAQ